MREKGQRKPKPFPKRASRMGPRSRLAYSGVAGASAGETVPQICAYIAAMATELHDIAVKADLPVIAYFLDMVRVEVDNILSQDKAGPPGPTVSQE